MTTYVLRRLGQTLITLVGISILTFAAIRLAPGNAIELYTGTQVALTPDQLHELKRMFGLDKPVVVQYVQWIGRVVKGNLGVSLRTSRPVAPDIFMRLPLTAELAVMAVLLAILIGVPLGVVAATSRTRFTDGLVRLVAIVGLSTPDFVTGTLAVLVFTHYVPILQLGNYVGLTVSPVRNLASLAVPALVFSVGLAAVLMRYVRSSLRDVLLQDYVRTAQAKGLKQRRVVYKHALKNALIPVITVLGIYLGYLMGGTVVIEEIFALPGLGRLTLTAISQRDYPLIQGIVLVVATLFMLINLATDILYASVDPRISYE